MTANTSHVHLALGSNLGDRPAALRGAVSAVEKLPGTRVVAVSSAWETASWGVTDQPAFLNAALAIETEMSPLDLLRSLKEIERDLGRASGGPKWGPRVIDIDIVLWGDRVIHEPALEVPHPEFRRRAFVLAPLAEIAPDARDPVTGKTVSELLKKPEVEGTAIRSRAFLSTDEHR